MQQTLKKLTKSVKVSIDSQDPIKHKNSLDSSHSSSRVNKTERKIQSARRRLSTFKKTSLVLPDLKVETALID